MVRYCDIRTAPENKSANISSVLLKIGWKPVNDRKKTDATAQVISEYTATAKKVFVSLAYFTCEYDAAKVATKYAAKSKITISPSTKI